MKIRLPIFIILLFFSVSATGQVASRFDIIIDELLPDPTPPAGLPSAEFIELKNTSGTTFNLSGWKISDGVSTATLPNFILQPDSFVIICATAAVTSFTAFGTSLGVAGFPSLDNDGDVISLRSSQNKIIHAVAYDISWYKNELKKAGGWTLEMIDTKNPCSGFSNWKAATAPAGGTPGKKNSVDAINKDQAAPKLLRAFAPDSVNLTLIFDEPMDSLKGSVTANYSVSDGIGTPQSAVPVAPVFDKVSLRLNMPILRNKIYTVNASNVTDCAGNMIGNARSAKVGLSSPPDSSEVVINEILFNPAPAAIDYVEIYNRSQKIIDLKQLFIANRNAANVISSIRQLSTESILFFPGDFFVISEDPSIVKSAYITTNPDAFLQISSLPSFPDDKGDVIILNASGNIVDEVKYTDKWHFALIANPEGVSLERIDYNAPSGQSNFHSAATSVGYGTPGYKNSQYRIDVQVKGEITVTPEIFSPDNDGMDDFATIDFTFPSAGYVANITIFDAAGRVVRYLQKNALCGPKGSFRWDGLGEKLQKLPMGIYILFTEIFNTEGKKKIFKNTIVLARRL